MDLSDFQTRDPHLLVGLVNTELRNHSDSLEDLARTHDIDADALVEYLREADYEYRDELQQFR